MKFLCVNFRSLTMTAFGLMPLSTVANHPNWRWEKSFLKLIRA